jgi:pilus assembly protein CpaC
MRSSTKSANDGPMKGRGTALAWPLALAIATATATGLAAPARGEPTAAAASMGAIQLSTGRGRLVTLSRPMSDLFVANPDIADVQVRSPTQLYVFAKKAGETTVSATAKSGAVVFASTVRVGNNFGSVQEMLDLAMPESRIVATPMNGVVLLTGTVAGPGDGAEAERLVAAYVGEGTKVLSRLKTATPLQVNLQVKFAEVNRSFLKNVGSNLVTRDRSGGFNFGVLSGRNPGTIANFDTSKLPQVDASSRFGFPAGTLTLPFDPRTGQFVLPDSGAQYTFTKNENTRSTFGLAGRLLGLDVLSAIDLGETQGQVTTLANPNLTALSGETGTFLAGGEIPIPISQALGTTTVEYKEFGVSLTYTPTVLADGRISLRVRPEVSQLDYSNAVPIGNIQIPALTTRRAETTVELGSGQSFMIAGLMSNNHNNTYDKTPGVGDLPVLGALFRSNAFQRNETELVIIITPYLVKPANAGEIMLPTDGYRAPTDLQRALLGQLDGGKSGEQRPKPTTLTGHATPPVSIGANAPLPPQANMAPPQANMAPPQADMAPPRADPAAPGAPGAPVQVQALPAPVAPPPATDPRKGKKARKKTSVAPAPGFSLN